MQQLLQMALKLKLSNCKMMMTPMQVGFALALMMAAEGDTEADSI